MSERMPVWLRITALAGWGLLIAVLAATAVFWQHDRARAWPAPRWDPRWFVRLDPTARALAPVAAAADSGESWVVAFQPLCSHCAESLDRAERRAAVGASHPRIIVLAIDCSRALAADLARRHPGHALFWDARQVWRERWGHRLYGEVLRFGGDGSYRGLVAAEGPAPD
jgi:hypothetical protein